MIDKSYIVIQPWMVTDLHLQDKELIVYAIVWGFSKDGQSTYNSGHKYIQEWFGWSKRTIINVLNSLKEKGLIIGDTAPNSNKGKNIRLRAVYKKVGANSAPVSANSAPSSANSAPSSANSAPTIRSIDNIYINNNNSINNIYNSARTTRRKKTENRFNNFPERQYNYGELEKQILRKQHGSG